MNTNPDTNNIFVREGVKVAAALLLLDADVLWRLPRDRKQKWEIRFNDVRNTMYEMLDALEAEMLQDPYVVCDWKIGNMRIVTMNEAANKIKK